MSKLLRTKKPTVGISAAIDGIDTLIRSRGSDLTTPEICATMVSVESATDQALMNDFQHHYDNAEADVKAQLEDTLSLEGISEAGLQAATVIALASSNLVAYAEAATSSNVPSMEGIDVINIESAGAYGAIDSRMTTAMEAFDEQELKKSVAYSIVFNALNANQDTFAEAFYPTTVFAPDTVGFDMTVERCTVLNEVHRSITGDVTAFGKRNIIDAMADASILENQATKVIPVYLADNSNADKFVDTALIAPVDLDVDGQSIKTSPLRNNVEFDLLALSQGLGGISGHMLDSTDSLDSAITLRAIYIKVTNVADPLQTSVLKFNTKGLPRSSFIKTAEGDSRDMQLTFSTSDLLIDAATTDIANVIAAGMPALQATTNKARLALKITGEINVELGTTQVFASSVKVGSIIDNNGDSISLTAGTGLTIVEDMTFEVLGYDLDATRSNGTRRTRGLLLDNPSRTERYPIPLGSPISVPAPVRGSHDSNVDLKSLIAVSRTRTSNNAVTKLLNYADHLRSFVANTTGNADIPNIEGIARYLVKPFFEELTLDIATEVNSIKTHEKAADVSSLLIDAIREIAYRMGVDSNFTSALETVNMGAAEKPVLTIGTDPTLARHLMVSGDDRTAAIGMDFNIVTSSDSRMKNKIVFTLSRASKGDPDPLCFGTHAYIPELTSSAQITRGGATTRETQVQPRSFHVNHLPIMAVITVQNLDITLTRKV